MQPNMVPIVIPGQPIRSGVMSPSAIMLSDNNPDIQIMQKQQYHLDQLRVLNQ